MHDVLSRIEHKVDLLLYHVARLRGGEAKMALQLDALEAQVKATTDAEEAAGLAFKELANMFEEASV